MLFRCSGSLQCQLWAGDDTNCYGQCPVWGERDETSWLYLSECQKSPKLFSQWRCWCLLPATWVLFFIYHAYFMDAGMKCITSSLQLPHEALESLHKVQRLWTFPGVHLSEHRDIFWDTISPVWVQAYHGQIKRQTTWHFLRSWLVCTLTHDTSAVFQPSPPQLREQEPVSWVHAHLSQVGSQISKCLCPFINMLLLCTLFSTHCCSTECNRIFNWF